MIMAMIMAAALAQEDPGYSVGPFNLVIRWGNSSPAVVKYENRARCEVAALMVVVQSDQIADRLDSKGHPIPPAPQVSGPNAPWAFCIPG